MPAGERDCVIAFIAATTITDDYGTHEDWASPTTLVTRNARVRLGSSQEQRQAAQEAASQSATFECIRSAALDAIPVTARIQYDGSQWDINGRSPMSRKDIWFTAIRLL
jgi:head-tail adaptor